jgi:hypothetical protein
MNEYTPLPASLQGLIVLIGIWTMITVLKMSSLMKRNRNLKKENTDLMMENDQLNRIIISHDKKTETKDNQA